MTADAVRRPADAVAFGLTVLFLVVMFTSAADWIPALAPLHLALASSSLAVGLMLARRVGQQESVSFDGIRGFALGMFGLLVVASIAWSIAPEISKGDSQEILKSVAIYFAMVNLVTTDKRLRVISLALILASIVPSIGVIRWWQGGQDLVEGFRARWIGIYADPNRMAMSIGIIVPLAIAFATRKQTGWPLRIACIAAGVLALTAIVLSHSRGGFIGLASALLLWTIREKRLGQIVLVVLLFIGMLLFAPESFWKRNETVADFHEDASAMGRVHAWSVTAAVSLDKPLLGVGVGTFETAWPLYAPPDAKHAYAAHNVFLQVIAELGFIGFAAFLVYVAAGVSGGFAASSDPESGWMARALSGSLVGYLICSLFAGFLTSPHLFVLIGLAACAHRIAGARAALVSTRAEGASFDEAPATAASMG